jgi:hypothetical protein
MRSPEMVSISNTNMRIRWLCIYLGIALVSGVTGFFSLQRAYSQSLAQGLDGLGRMIGAIGAIAEIAGALAGERPTPGAPEQLTSPPPAPAPAPTMVTDFDWSKMGLFCGFFAIVAFYFALQQLAAWFDERGIGRA